MYISLSILHSLTLFSLLLLPTQKTLVVHYIHSFIFALLSKPIHQIHQQNVRYLRYSPCCFIICPSGSRSSGWSCSSLLESKSITSLLYQSLTIKGAGLAARHNHHDNGASCWAQGRRGHWQNDLCLDVCLPLPVYIV